MKKVLFALALGFLFVACEKPAPEGEPAPVYEYFKVLTPEADLMLPAVIEGETATLEVKVEADYPEFTVSVEGEWLTYLTPAKSAADAVEHTLAFTYGPNKVEEVLTAVVKVNAGEEVIGEFTVKQAAYVKTAKYTRVWGQYTTTTPWYNFGVDPSAATNLDRGMAMDNDYVYVAKSTAWAPVITGFSLTDAAVTKTVNVSGLGNHSGINTFSVGNALASIKNGANSILLASNLKGDTNLEIWAWKDGVDAAPTKIADYKGGFLPGQTEITPDWRRYGDRMTVVGDWTKGQIWLASFNQLKTLVFNIENGVVTNDGYPVEHVIMAADGIKEVVVYPGSEDVFITTNGTATFFSDLKTPNPNGWNQWMAGESVTAAGLTYGYNFFEFDGKNLIAYTKIEEANGSKARLVIIEDNADGLKAALDANVVVFEAPLQSDSFDVAPESITANSIGNCNVTKIGDVIYVAAHAQGLGCSVFTLTME